MYVGGVRWCSISKKLGNPDVARAISWLCMRGMSVLVLWRRSARESVEKMACEDAMVVGGGGWSVGGGGWGIGY